MNDDLPTVTPTKTQKRYTTSPSTSLYGSNNRIDRAFSDETLREAIDTSLRNISIAYLVDREVTAELRRRIRRLLAEG